MARRMTPATAAHPFVRLIWERMIATGLKLEDVAAHSGVNQSTIRDWKSRTVPALPNIEAALEAVGLKLVAVPIGDSDCRGSGGASVASNDRGATSVAGKVSSRSMALKTGSV